MITAGTDTTEIARQFGATLLGLARDSIRHGLEHRAPLPVLLQQYPPELRTPFATFVTLHCHEQLRGCIGSLDATRPLVIDVVENAYASAYTDPRFSPLTMRELQFIKVHISVLSPPETMTFTTEDDLLQQLRPGIDGVILEEHGRRGTFLPSVWEQLAQPVEFLQQLKRKTGLPANYWSNTLRAKRYVCALIG